MDNAYDEQRHSPVPFHPAFPSAANLSREHAATDRDVADLATLRELRQLVADAFAAASRANEIRHPDRRWMVADLLDALQDQLADINDTIALVQRGPVVIEDEG
jgi:hypothetical protein